MRKRSRFRPVAKWVGAGAVVLVLALWVGSYFWCGWYLWRTKTWGWQTDCNWGTLFLYAFRWHDHFERQWELRPGLYIYSRARERDVLAQYLIVQDWPPDRNHYGFVLPKLVTRVPPLTGWAFVFALRLPLWFPLLILAVPTGILFWRDRRYPSGHCQTCGYNLTGNVSGRCPECGEAT